MGGAPVKEDSIRNRREYKLLSDDDNEKLSALVTGLLQAGWDLEGGHNTCKRGNYLVRYSQALTRIAPITKEN